MKQYSTRTALFLIGIAISLCFAISITFFFNSNMIALLKQREVDQIRRFNAQALNLLERDTEYLSTSLKDWASQGDIYEFLSKRGPMDTDAFPALNPIILLRLNYEAIIGNNGFTYERHFDNSDSDAISGTIKESVLNDALREASMWMFREAQLKYHNLFVRNDIFETLNQSQVAGFVNIDGTAYFMSAVPVIRPSGEIDSNGTLIFARKITPQVLSRLTLSDEERASGETDISIRVVDSKWMRDGTVGAIQYIDRGARISLQSIIPSVDDSVIVMTVAQERSMYKGSIAMIQALSILVFIFACALSSVLLCTMEFWLLRPISTLARKVANINYDLPVIDIPSFRGRELNVLSNSIRELLLRVDEHKTYIEAQNSTLSVQNKMLHTLANYDPHTNLPNKNLFKNILKDKIAEAKERGHVVAVMYLDIINFRLINDARGRATGDMVLIAIANRLNSTFGMLEENTIACFGRDNFALIVGAKSRDEVMMSAYSLISIFNEPFSIDTHEIVVNISVGITVAPFDGDTFDELDACANIAMNNARDTSDTSSFLFFDHKQLENVISKYNRIAEIKKGLERGEFKVVFQPKLDVRSNLITSSEALVRWYSPMGIIPPATFIPDACETGLIVPLTWEILRQSFNGNNRFMKELGLEMSVGVNVPNNVLLHSDFISVLTDLLSQTQMGAEHLNVELTEDVLVNDMKKCNSRMNALQRMGAQISIDDFGTGYASLQYLSKMPFNWMKIDKTFVDGIPDKTQEMAIIDASVGIARGLGMKIVLEGVETTRQWDMIVQQNYCDQIQGYVISRPLEEENFLTFVSDWNEKARSASKTNPINHSLV